MKRKKRFWGLAGFFLVMISMLAAFSVPVSAERKYPGCEQSCRLYDPDHVMDEEMTESVNQMISETSDTIDMYMAVFIYNQSSFTTGDSDVAKQADKAYDELFNPQEGEDSDGLLLWIDLPSRYLYISTSGRGEFYYYNGSSEDRISQMVSRLGETLSSKNYHETVELFCKDAISYYKEGAPRGAYTYNADTGMYRYLKKGALMESKHKPFWLEIPWGILIGTGLFLGGLTAAIIAYATKMRYNAVLTPFPSNYVCEQDTVFSVKDDIFLRKHVTKTAASSDSSSSSSSDGSSHSSSGGHSHGGGGGHW